MNDQIEQTTASPEEIVEFLKSGFVFTDNIPEDTNRRREIVMEARASILIDSHCIGGRFPTFMKAGQYIEGAWAFPLPQPFSYKTNNMNRHDRQILDWSFREFIVYPDNILKPDIYGQTSRWRLLVNADPTQHISNAPFYDWTLGQKQQWLSSEIIEIQKAFANTYSSLWQLCKDITPYNTPDRACRFFGNAPFPFAPLKLNNSMLRPDIFYYGQAIAQKQLNDLRLKFPELGEEAFLQQCLYEAIEKSQEQFIVSDIYSKRYENWLKMVYIFKNEYGEPIMKVAKLYNAKSQTKSLIPMTMWMRNNSTTDQLFCVPLPEDKQPLYNLDLLKADEESPVILTDSIEIADANKRDGAIFTSFICDLGQYDQVDWSPLKNRTVYYLVTNHSGSLLESAYLRARKLAEYFKNEQEINLKFIQLKVKYHEKPHFASVDDLLLHYRNDKPEIKTGSVEIFENDETFNLQYEKAVAFINTKTTEWWENHSKNTEELRLVKDETEKLKAIDYVLHPILIRGEATMIYAKKSTGKSAFAFSLAALAASSSNIGPKRILKEKWWSISRKQSKVLYLDFENKERTLEDRYKDFAYPQWPDDKMTREECKRNLIVEDMTKFDHLDYSEPANHQKIIDLIDKAKAKGIAGQPVDLLVIDTYTKFVNNETPQTSDNFSDFLNKIRGMNIAILIVHHSNDEGLPRGFKKMLDDLYLNIRLYRIDNNLHDLKTPLNVKYVSTRSRLPDTMWEEFKITFTDGKWEVKEPTKNENEELRDIVKAYRASRYQDETIWKMIGLGSSAFYERLKKK